MQQLSCHWPGVQDDMSSCMHGGENPAIQSVCAQKVFKQLDWRLRVMVSLHYTIVSSLDFTSASTTGS